MQLNKVQRGHFSIWNNVGKLALEYWFSEMRHVSQETIQKIFQPILFQSSNSDVVQTGKYIEKLEQTCKFEV